MKKLLLTLVLALSLSLVFTIAVFADRVHNENTVNYGETVTLNDGTTVNIFDNEGNALIWYLDSAGALKSIRTDDQQVKWYTESWNEVTGVGINFDDGTKVSKNNFVVVNMMDDDIITNSGPGASTPEATHYGKPIKSFKLVFEGCKKLEYVYLRLDQSGIFRQSFNGCSSLKYINFEDLTLLKNSRDGMQFGSCSALFAGQVLDLSNTSLVEITGGGTFSGTSFVGVKLPSTVKYLGDWVFQGNTSTYFMFPENLTAMPTNAFKKCANLQEIYLNAPLASIGDNAFLECYALERIFFVGTKSELEALIANTGTTGNTQFFAVVGENNENLISYSEYLALEDKSGKYAVYGYSYCEAYNDGNHEVTGTNPCVGVCTVCQNNIVKHAENAQTAIVVEYVSFGQNGVKATVCTNEGCTYRAEEELEALITCRGFSYPEYEEGIISFNFYVNQEAIDTYTALTGESVKYGLFAALKSTVGNRELIDENGDIIDGVISAEMPEDKFSILGLKIFGFESDVQKASEFAMGVYVITEKDGVKKASYVQNEKPIDGEKYYYVSYNAVFSDEQ